MVIKNDTKEFLNIPDRDEIKEYYGFTYKSSDEWRKITTKETQMSFEGYSIQDILDNFHTFLNTVGFTYVGEIEITSKDGEKSWRTDGSHT
jgi:hypothetical protein|tara:strand:+ start:814 stop:1086 length:273 start_codon:yes stop_codon:yes gene_type:complete